MIIKFKKKKGGYRENSEFNSTFSQHNPNELQEELSLDNKTALL